MSQATIVTRAPAIVVREPGNESQRVLITSNAQSATREYGFLGDLAFRISEP